MRLPFSKKAAASAAGLLDQRMQEADHTLAELRRVTGAKEDAASNALRLAEEEARLKQEAEEKQRALGAPLYIQAFDDNYLPALVRRDNARAALDKALLENVYPLVRELVQAEAERMAAVEALRELRHRYGIGPEQIPEPSCRGTYDVFGHDRGMPLISGGLCGLITQRLVVLAAENKLNLRGW